MLWMDSSVNNRMFHNLTITEQQQILDYRCKIYFCEGNDKEKLDWFKIINIAGEKLTDQELRNAVYTGTWLTSAKRIFSKTQCAAYNLSNKYVTGSPIRQELLQTAISWKNKGNIEEYMSIHQHDPNANELSTYFQNVINWVMLTFPNYRKEMKGIYEFVLSGEECYLNIRTFTESQKRRMYEYQKGICNMCHQHFEYEEMQEDHITPWSKGGKTVDDNLQMLCEDCNRKKLNM